MQRLSNLFTTPPKPFSMAGTYGSLTVAPRDQAVAIQTVGRSYDTHGHLHVSASLVRIPIAEAYRLHEALGRAIIEAESIEETRQTAQWGGSPARVSRRTAA